MHRIQHRSCARPSIWFIPFLLLALGLISLTGCSSKPLTSGKAEYGKASYYAMMHQGNKTANGERFNQSAFTAAHRTLPFGTRVRVTNLRNDKSVVVRINDRGPFVRGRIIDLSQAAFKKIGSLKQGLLEVKVEVLGDL